MGACHKLRLLFVHLILQIFLFVDTYRIKAFTIPRTPNNSITSILVFGDSTVDTGNNNYVPTLFKSNFPPYGMDFPNHKPTGRFTNGRMVTDFIASYVGVKKYVPPYLDPNLSIGELMSGVSFASAGSGFDPLTAQISGVIGMEKQLKYLKEYKKKLENSIGEEKMKNHINGTLFVVSAGTNDFIVNYYSLPIRSRTYNISAYQQFVLHKQLLFIQDLFNLGARRISVVGLSPMGCLPVVITLHSQTGNTKPRNCVDFYSTVAREFNAVLQIELGLMQARLKKYGFKIYLSDAYSPMVDMIQGIGSSAFDNVNAGCCGTGYIEAGIMCNSNSQLCSDTSKYVFFDAMHPTEMAYFIIFQAMRPVLDLIIRD